MKTPRTKKEILADPRVSKDPKQFQDGSPLWQEEDGCFAGCNGNEGVSYWCVMAPGWRVDETKTAHEPTIKKICQAIRFATYDAAEAEAEGGAA